MFYLAYQIHTSNCSDLLINNLKGELKPEISLLHMKVLKFFDTCNAVAAREDRKSKY